MELELGLKITRTREDVSSSVDFRFSKDPFGPLVLSRETDSRFIIIIHLKGFKKEGIEIEINKEGNRITIRGRKPVEELVLIRWMAWRKEVELRTFKKVFQIPDVVDLDKIKARFDDDNSTLTITMPKRAKGITGLNIEEEEEEEDVCEHVNREEIENREEIDEDDVERAKSDERSESEIQREEEFGENMGDKERESQVFEGAEEGFSGVLDEEEETDHNLKEIPQIDQQNKILESELADSNTGSEDSSLRKLPDIKEERDYNEQTRHEEQENNQELVVEQRDSQAETKSDDIGSRAFGEIEEQEPDEQLDTTSTSGATEKKTTNDDGSRKVQGTKGPERQNEETKIQEMVEGETVGHEKKKIVNMERKQRDSKDEVDGKTGEGITTNIEKPRVDGEDDIAETETKTELESNELEADEVDKIHELVEKKEEETAEVGRQSEDRSLIKLQENAEQHSKGQKRQDKEKKTKELVEEKIPEAETNVADDTSGITGDEAKQEKEECESETLKADEEEKIQKLIDKKEENATMGTSEDINLTKLQVTEEQQFQGQKQHDKQEKLKELVKEQNPEAETDVASTDTPKPVQERGEGKHKIQKNLQEETKSQPEEHKEKMGRKINDAGERQGQEIIRQQELVKSTINEEEKEVAERETKEQGSNRPKLLWEPEKIRELADKKTNFSENERVNEKKTEFGDDYISRKVGDIKQRDSETMEGEEEKDKTELERGEKVSDGGKGIIAVSETLAENYKSTKVQEVDEQQSHEEETCGNQYQKLRGEASGRQEVEDVENAKKTPEAEKRTKDSTIEAQEIEKKDSDVSGNHIKGTTIQELEENRGVHRNKHEEENNSEADRLEKIAGRIQQELVNLNSQLEQDNIEEERTQEVVEEKPKDCKEEEVRKDKANEESKPKTSDDVVRKVQGTKEQELCEPKREHVSKINELIEEKETTESEIEAEYCSSRKVDCSEGQELHEPKIHKERDKTPITGTGKPSGQDIEEKGKTIASETITKNENSTHIQETKEKQSDKPESHEKRSKIQELVELGNDDRKEEQREETVVAKEEQETEEDNSKKVQEIENQEYDELKRSMVQDKRQDTEEKDKTRAMEGKEMVERRITTKDGSLRKARDDDFPELSEPHKRQEEDKFQELVEMGTSDYRERVKKLPDGSDTLRNQEAERTNLDEYKRHNEQRNIPQLVEDDSSGKSYEDWTHEEREKRQDLVKEEETESKGKKSGGVGRNDHTEEQQQENVIAKAELKTEEDSSKKVQETEKQESDDLKRSVVHDKTQKKAERDKIRAMEAKDIVERRTKTKDSCLGKVRDDDFPEPCKSYKRQEEDKVQELEESDYSEKVKKQDEDDILTSQEADRPDLDDFERNSEQRNISQLVEDDSSGKLHELEELKSYEEWTHEEREKIRDLKEEVTDPKDKYSSGEGHNDHKEKQQKNVIAKAELKTEEDISKNVEETEQQEYDELKESVVQEKMQETKDKGKTRAMEENDIVERREETKESSLRKIQEGEDPELDKHKKHGEVDRIQELVETVIRDHREKIKKKDEDDNTRREDVHQSVEDEKGEGKLETNSEPGGKMEGDSLGKRNDFQKERSYENSRQEDSEEVKNLVKDEATDTKDKHIGGREHEEATKIQETEKEELHESERHEKLDIVEDVVEDKTEDQKDEEAEEAAAVVAENEKESSRKVQTIEKQESGEHKEQNKIPRINDPEAKEEDEERVAEEESKEKEAHVQELEGKTENWKDDGSAGRRGEQEKTVESKSEDRIPTKIRDTKIQESNENKNQESEVKSEELERKETSNHETMLVTEDDNLRKGQEFLEKDSNVPKVRLVEQKKIQEVKEVDKREDEEKAAEKKFQMHKLLELDESEEKEELKKILEPMEEEKWGPEKGNGKIAEEEMQDEINSRIKDEEIKGQEPYELLRNGVHNKTPELIVKGTKDHNREEEKEMEERETEVIKRKSEDVSSRKVQQIKAEESEKHRKLSDVQENDNIGDSAEENIQAHKEGEMKEEGGYKRMASSQSQDDEVKGSYQPEQDAEQVKIQKLKAKMDGKEEYDIREGEQMEKVKNGPEILRGQKQKEKHEEVVETRTSDQRKEENEEDDLVRKAETIDEDDSSRKIQEHEKGNSDKVERHEQEEMSRNTTKEETNVDKEGNRAGIVSGEGETKITNSSFGKVRETIKQEQDMKKSFVEEERSSKEKEKKNQEAKGRDDSSRKTRANEKQVSHEQNRNEEQDNNLELVGKKINYSINEEDDKEDEKMMKRHENRDNIKELVEEKVDSQEKEDRKRMVTKVSAKDKDHESKGREGLSKQDQSKELEQRLRDNFRDEETAKTETKGKDNESRKTHQIKEQETSEQESLKEQGRVKELVEYRTHSHIETESEDGNSKNIQEIDKRETIKPGGDEIQEPVDRETSEDEEEELEIEFEEEEEEWEAEVIQEKDSDEDNNKLREIRRIKLGFRFVGGSALFMSFIVIVIRFIHSKRKIRCYKF